MTEKHEPPARYYDTADARLDEIYALFAGVRKMIRDVLDNLGPPDPNLPRGALSKINELQTLHVSAIKAEETFHEKFNGGTPDNGIDYDALRAEIGRQLDRIRAALGAKDLSE